MVSTTWNREVVNFSIHIEPLSLLAPAIDLSIRRDYWGNRSSIIMCILIPSGTHDLRIHVSCAYDLQRRVRGTDITDVFIDQLGRTESPSLDAGLDTLPHVVSL